MEETAVPCKNHRLTQNYWIKKKCPDGETNTGSGERQQTVSGETHDYRKFSEISAALGNSATIINLPNNYLENSPTPDS